MSKVNSIGDKKLKVIYSSTIDNNTSNAFQLTNITSFTTLLFIPNTLNKKNYYKITIDDSGLDTYFVKYNQNPLDKKQFLFNITLKVIECSSLELANNIKLLMKCLNEILDVYSISMIKKYEQKHNDNKGFIIRIFLNLPTNKFIFKDFQDNSENNQTFSIGLGDLLKELADSNSYLLKNLDLKSNNFDDLTEYLIKNPKTLSILMNDCITNTDNKIVVLYNPILNKNKALKNKIERIEWNNIQKSQLHYVQHYDKQIQYLFYNNVINFITNSNSNEVFNNIPNLTVEENKTNSSLVDTIANLILEEIKNKSDHERNNSNKEFEELFKELNSNENLIKSNDNTISFTPEQEIMFQRPINRILSLDGGGVCAITTLIILQKLSEYSGFPIHIMFDLFSGNSAGSINTAMLGLYFRNIDELIKTCDNTAFTIFGKHVQNKFHLQEKTQIYDTTKIRELFQQEDNFGQHFLTEFSSGKSIEEKNILDLYADLPKNRLTYPYVSIVSVDISKVPAQTFLFRNYSFPSKDIFNPKLVYYNGTDKAKVFRAVSASSAAPIFFYPVIFPRVFENNIIQIYSNNEVLTTEEIDIIKKEYGNGDNSSIIEILPKVSLPLALIKASLSRIGLSKIKIIQKLTSKYIEEILNDKDENKHLSYYPVKITRGYDEIEEAKKDNIIKQKILVDGGILHNNPSFIALEEHNLIKKFRDSNDKRELEESSSLDKILLVSIGTGKAKTSDVKEEFYSNLLNSKSIKEDEKGKILIGPKYIPKTAELYYGAYLKNLTQQVITETEITREYMDITQQAPNNIEYIRMNIDFDEPINLDGSNLETGKFDPVLYNKMKESSYEYLKSKDFQDKAKKISSSIKFRPFELNGVFPNTKFYIKNNFSVDLYDYDYKVQSNNNFIELWNNYSKENYISILINQKIAENGKVVKEDRIKRIESLKQKLTNNQDSLQLDLKENDLVIVESIEYPFVQFIFPKIIIHNDKNKQLLLVEFLSFRIIYTTLNNFFIQIN
jgi:patatin-like phospholipase/acyl hydrolase